MYKVQSFKPDPLWRDCIDHRLMVEADFYGAKIENYFLPQLMQIIGILLDRAKLHYDSYNHAHTSRILLCGLLIANAGYAGQEDAGPCPPPQAGGQLFITGSLLRIKNKLFYFLIQIKQHEKC